MRVFELVCAVPTSPVEVAPARSVIRGAHATPWHQTCSSETLFARHAKSPGRAHVGARMCARGGGMRVFELVCAVPTSPEIGRAHV